MTMAAGDEAFVTFGAGMSTQLINNAIAPSGLFTLGAAHGEVATAGGWGQAAVGSSHSNDYLPVG